MAPALSVSPFLLKIAGLWGGTSIGPAFFLLLGAAALVLFCVIGISAWSKKSNLSYALIPESAGDAAPSSGLSSKGNCSTFCSDFFQIINPLGDLKEPDQTRSAGPPPL